MAELLRQKYQSLMWLAGWLALASVIMANCKWE